MIDQDVHACNGCWRTKPALQAESKQLKSSISKGQLAKEALNFRTSLKLVLCLVLMIKCARNRVKCTCSMNETPASIKANAHTYVRYVPAMRVRNHVI